MAFGEVVSTAIVNNMHIGSGQSKRYGFVEMPSKSEGQASITALDGKSLRDRTIDVIRYSGPTLFLRTTTRGPMATREIARSVAE